MEDVMHASRESLIKASKEGINQANVRRFDRDLMAAKTEEIVRQNTANVAKVLTPSQMRRLREIALQVEGYLSLRHEEIQNALYLMPYQKEEIGKIMRKLKDEQYAAKKSLNEKFYPISKNYNHNKEYLKSHEKTLDSWVMSGNW